MKNIYTITEQEKNRILGMHQNATKKQYLMEQDVNIEPTGLNSKSPESTDVFNRLNWYCTEDRNNTLATQKPITEERKAYIEKIADNFLYNVNFTSEHSGPRREHVGYLKSALSEMKTGAELCYLHNYIRSKKNIPSGIHGALSTNRGLNFSWKMALDAMTPAFTDAHNILQGTQTPEQAEVGGDKTAADNKPVEGIAASLINLIRDKAGAKRKNQPTLDDGDLKNILAKVQELQDKQQ